MKVTTNETGDKIALTLEDSDGVHAQIYRAVIFKPGEPEIRFGVERGTPIFLNQKEVAALIPHLQAFVDTGELELPEQVEVKQVTATSFPQPVVPMIPVVGSSNIREVGYRRDYELLAVRFNSGKLYHYYEVTPKLGSDILATAPTETASTGSLFAQQVRGKTPFLLIDESSLEELGGYWTPKQASLIGEASHV